MPILRRMRGGFFVRGGQQLLSWLARGVAWSAPLVVGCAVAVVTSQLPHSARDTNSLDSRDGPAVAAAPHTDQNTITTTIATYSSRGTVPPTAPSSVSGASPSAGLIRSTTADPTQQPSPTGSIPTDEAPTSTITFRTTTSTTVASTTSTLPAAPNQPPVAVSDQASARRAATIHIDVLANDYDVDGNLDPLSVSLIDVPVGPAADPGSALVRTRNGRDEIDFRAPLVAGDFSFTYQVCDTSAVCSTASVRVTVTL